MKKMSICILLIAFCTFLFSQETGSVQGKVIDWQTREALQNATIFIKGTKRSTLTDKEGHFVINKISPGRVSLIISYVGYKDTEILVIITGGDTFDINIIGLLADPKEGNDVVVSASKRAEKITDAPASIRVIGKKELDEFAGSNVFELAAYHQGVEFVRSGIDYVALNARGFNRAANNKILQIVDNRIAMTTISIGLPTYNYSTVNKEDVDRIEVVLGPQAALYGPNAHNAIFNTIMKDPRKSRGTTVAISGGNRFQFSGRLRHAAKINDKWAYKLTGEYVTGNDFQFYDSVYAGNQPPGLNPYYGPAITIPERNVNFDFRRIRGEAHVYYSLTQKADVIISGGTSDNNSLGVANGGRNQMQGVRYGFLQARFVHKNFFATIYNTWGSLRTSYSIASYTTDYWNRTHSTITNCDLFPDSCYLPPEEAEKNALRPGNTFKEINQRLNAEAQYNYYFENAGLFLIAGISYQKEKPKTFGYSLVDKDQRIYVTQAGGVVQLEKKLPWDLRLIGAARFDNHSNFGNFFSPKLALTKSIGENNVRMTWARAYSMPSIFFQYANADGFFFGNGPGVKYKTNGPGFSDPATEKVTTPLKPEENNTWEIGYKGTIEKKIFIDINGYYGINKNFLSPPQPVAGRAIAVGKFPVSPAFPGSVTNDTLNDALFTTFFNYGDVKAYGVDIGLNYSFNKIINLALRYSWFDSDITKDNLKNDANSDGYVSSDEKSLNAPRHRGVAIVSFQNLYKQKLYASIAARFTESYDFYSGSQIGTANGKGSQGKIYWGDDPVTGTPRYYIKNFDWGPLGGFVIIDLGAGYKLNDMIKMNMNITNLFNVKQREFVGSPYIGRLICFELKMHVPEHKRR
ncbi:MAG TPA: TonB-dependent receptor [Chitinophagaceae bacterium]